MAIKQVVLLTCDRCGREEQLEEDTYDGKSAVVFTARYKEDVVSFADLCGRCQERLPKIMASLKLEKPEPSEESPSGPGEEE